MKTIFSLISVLASAAILTSCVSGKIAEQRKQRDRLSQQTGFYCDFINGETAPAIELELNLQLAKKCNPANTFAVTNYMTSSEQRGVVFCCILAEKDKKTTEAPVHKETKDVNKDNKTNQEVPNEVKEN